VDNDALLLEEVNDYESSSPFSDAYEEDSANNGYESSANENEIIESPFSYAYENSLNIEGVSSEEEALSELVNELYDEEFDRQIYNLASIVRADYESIRSADLINQQSSESILNVLDLKMQPIVDYGEKIIDEYIKIFDEVDIDSITENEFERLLESVDVLEPEIPAGSQIYENLGKFFKKIGKKIKNTAKKAYKYAKKTAKNIIKNPVKAVKNLAKDAKKFVKNKLKKALNWLKKLLKKLLSHIVKIAAGLLPKKLRPLAKKLARKLSREVGEEYSEEERDNGIAYIQKELDLSISYLLISDESRFQDEVFYKEVITSFLNENNFVSPQMVDEYDNYRDEFIRNIINLSESEVVDEKTVEPVVEGFISSIIKAVKIGYRLLGGRPKLYKFVVGILTKLISKYVGKKNSKALAKAITDAGFRIFNLEYQDENEAIISAEMIASTIEGTMKNLSMMPEDILGNDELVSSFIIEAFENSAASYFPPVLSEKIYENRPDLRESYQSSAWVDMSRKQIRRKNRKILFGRKKKYKKCTRVITRKINPEMLDMVKSWKGRSLKSILKKCRKTGHKRKPVKIRAHMFELEQGGWVSDIISNEADSLGLTTTGELALEQFHPLTQEASAVLFDEPRYGRNVNSKYLVDPVNTVSGQRLYYLEFIDNEQFIGHQTRQPCCLQHVTLDFVQNQIRLSTLLDENQAENISLMLSRGAGTGAIVRQIRQIYTKGIEKAFNVGADHQLHIIHGKVLAGHSSGNVLSSLPGLWIIDSLSELRSQVIIATQNPASGITLSTTVVAPAFLVRLNNLLAGQAVGITQKLSDRTGGATLKIVPGEWHG